MIGFKIGDEFLELPPGTSIPIEWESGLFGDYVIGGIGTLPFSFPFTAKNKRLLQHFNMVSNALKNLVLDCELWLAGNFWAKGKLTVAIKGQSFDCDWSEVNELAAAADKKLESFFDETIPLITPFFRQWEVNYSYNTPGTLGLNIYINGVEHNFEVPYIGQTMQVAIEDLYNLVVANSLINSLFDISYVWNPALSNAGKIVFKSKTAVIIKEAESFAFINYGAITTANAVFNLNHQTNLIKSALEANISKLYGESNICFPTLLNEDFYSNANTDNVKTQYSLYLNYYFQNYVRNEFIPLNDKLYKYAISPQLFLFYAIETVFNKFNYTVAGSFAELDQIKYRCFIYNNFAIDAIGSEQTASLVQKIYNFWQGQVKVNDHIPDITLKEFLSALKSIFCISFWPQNSRGAVSIELNKAILKTTTEINWTNRSFKIYNELTGNFDNGFTLSYNYDTGDAMLSDTVKSIDFLIKQPVATFADLPIYNVQNGEIRLVEDENIYYIVNQPEITPGNYPRFKWEFYSYNLHEFKQSDNSKNLANNHCPTVMLRHHDKVNQGREILTPAIKQGGSSYEYNIRLNRVPLRLMFYWGIANGLTYEVPEGSEDTWTPITDPARLTYPFASFENIDLEENILGPYSLRWQGQYGLYENFWKDWLAFLNQTKTLKIQIILTTSDLLSLDLKSKIRIGESLFFIEKISFNLSRSIQEILCTVDLKTI